ncbi:SGNH/GDSL hydrolase family protein [Patulibacter minatonensis]|uniref:SGNH/GDSL hydrolase family protein n=1 Tax=Patulibacter minatonensis TaxID=298163 RepID=UPI00047C0810|nr:SGNH/GDSL hydrolase family protein [Patulibacter minatonensis]
MVPRPVAAGRVRSPAHIALLVLLLLLAAVAAGPASAAAPSGKPYVALGDSYSSGPGLEPTREPGCARSAVNYASVLARELGLGAERRGRWADYSCAGATAAGPGTSVPVQVGWAAADRTIGPATRVVTFTAGGNDPWAGRDHDTLYDVLAACVRAGTPCGPARRAGPLAQLLPDALTDLLPSDLMRAVASVLAGDDERSRWLSPDDLTPGRMTATLRPAVAAIRARAPRATIAVVGYPRVVPPTGSSGCAGPVGLGWALDADEVTYLDALLAAYDRAQRAAAAALGRSSGPVRFVDVRTPSAGHDLCAGDAAWVSAPVLGGLGFLGESLHPKDAGMAEIAGLVERATSVEGLRPRRR